MSNNNKNTSPTQNTNPSPSAQDPTTTTIPDSDLTAEPEEITHSDAHDPFTIIVLKEGMPLPEELEQNGKPTSKGGPQEVQRSLEEMKEDFRRKYGVRGSGVRAPTKGEGGGYGKGKKEGEDGKGGDEKGANESGAGGS